MRRVPTLIYRRDWRRAGEAAYEALARQTFSPRDIGLGVAAIRMHARATRDYERARQALQSAAGVTWESGKARLPGRPGLREAAIGLADVLTLMDRKAEATALLQALLERMRREVEDEGRSELWFQKMHPIALVLHGAPEAALAMLERATQNRSAAHDWWFQFEIEPVYEPLRRHPRFVAMRETIRTHSAEQRRELDRRRADGRIPQRPADRASAAVES